TILPLAGAGLNRPGWVAVAVPAARLQLLFLALTFAILTHAFINHDFSVAYVAHNSNSLLPLMYRISAVWGAHEGSLLLWILILSGWTVAVTLFSRNLPPLLRARIIAVMGLVSVGFLLFTLFTSNPFLRYIPAPADGADLNPLLQDPGLIIHPPMLYMGYVGFSVAFAFAVAALLGGHLDSTWARWSRPWTIMAWAFLTIGIALGSWWAYYELGWGGWWFWDPVENASFMPWLIGTALIHSLAATEKRDVFKNWTVLLAIGAFSLSLLGTFLVRSGVLTSVHAFATDPARGVFILILLGVVIGGSLALYAWRAPHLLAGNRFSLISRETFLLLNSVLLSVAMIAVLLGTLYPLIMETLGIKLSVGAPYFNTVFVPLMLPLTLVLGFGVSARWRSDEWRRLWLSLRHVAVGCLLIGVIVMLALPGAAVWQVAVGIGVAAWIILSNLYHLYQRLRLPGLFNQPLAFYGMTLAHIGFALTIVGITISSQFSTELHKRMGPGSSETFAGYRFTMQDLNIVQGPNYTATEARLSVYKGKRYITELRSQKRLYTVREMPMTEAGIDSGLLRDLYVSLGEPLDSGDWSVRLYHKPLVRFIWLGAIFMALGGLLAAGDRRYRLRLREKLQAESPVEPGQVRI
ncbi:MAG: heme lyase CcmF/NrfE family subunit, partial [Gammaproteobacteria bacterium]